MKQTEWLDRKFAIIADSGLLPSILERLEGTPLRAEAIITQATADLLISKFKGKWSIQEELGHLSDLEPLWLGRVHELIQNVSILRAADMSNQKTHTANHNAKDVKALLQEFKMQRSELIKAMRNLTDEQIEKTALHPRLKTPMRMVDLAYFVAEHDDHHLATMRSVLSRNFA